MMEKTTHSAMSSFCRYQTLMSAQSLNLIENSSTGIPMPVIRRMGMRRLR